MIWIFYDLRRSKIAYKWDDPENRKKLEINRPALCNQQEKIKEKEVLKIIDKI